MRLLKSDRGIDRSGGTSGTALGAEERKDSCFAGASGSSCAAGAESSESLEQGLRAGGIFQIFTCTRAHAGHNVRRMSHFAVGEDGDLQGGGANQFDGVNGALRILRWNVDNHDFGARVLQLSKNGIRRPDGKSDMAWNTRASGGASHRADFVARISVPGPRSGGRRRSHA